MNELPLSGIRVIDLGIVLAGPIGAMMLGDLGADVVRVESTEYFATSTRGQLARPSCEFLASLPAISGGYPDREPGERPWNRFPWFNAAGRNKRGLTLDLTRPRGLELFNSLLRLTDVIVINQSPGLARRLGIDYDKIAEINPEIVYVNASLFGSKGPLSTYKGGGPQMESFAGHDTLRHYRDSDLTTNSWLVPSDAAGGASIALAAILGLHAREESGKGQYIDISLVENEIALLGPHVLEAAFTGANPPPLGNRNRSSLQGCYRCAGDDRWLTLTVPDEDGWRGLADLLGHPEFVDEPYGDHLWRTERHDEVDAAISAWAESLERDAAVSALVEVGVWAGPVLPESEILNDPQLIYREHFMVLDHVDTGRFRYPGPPYRLRESVAFPMMPPVRLGEHNDEILTDLLGLYPKEIEELQEDRLIGEEYAPNVL